MPEGRLVKAYGLAWVYVSWVTEPFAYETAGARGLLALQLGIRQCDDAVATRDRDSGLLAPIVVCLVLHNPAVARAVVLGCEPHCMGACSTYCRGGWLAFAFEYGERRTE